MIKGRKIGHLGLATNHIEKNLAWYIDVLGFEQIASFVTPKGEPVYFLQGNGFIYEMYQPQPAVPKEQEGKIDHFAFDSADIEEDYKECVTAGYHITTNGIEEIPTFWERGIRYFKIASPTGEEFEFCQIM